MSNLQKTEYTKLRTKIIGIIEGLMYSDEKYFEVRRALVYAENVHCHERKDGAKEFSHQLEMLSIALSMHSLLLNPRDVYLAIIVHDTIEDYPEESQTMMTEFPEAAQYSRTLAKFCDTHTLSAIGVKEYSQYFNNIASCEVCSIVKLIDRIHNLSTAPGVFSTTKITEYVDEVQKYFIPMYRTAKSIFNQRTAYEVLKTMLLTQCRTIETFVNLLNEAQGSSYPQEVLNYVKTH